LRLLAHLRARERDLLPDERPRLARQALQELLERQVPGVVARAVGGAHEPVAPVAPAWNDVSPASGAAGMRVTSVPSWPVVDVGVESTSPDPSESSADV